MKYIARRLVHSVSKHPNADKLALVKVGTYQVVHPLSDAKQLKRNQRVVHFPTDICIHPDKAKELGVDKYCRSVAYKNEGEKVPCHIIAARLRGAPSYGFILPNCDVPDDELDSYFGVWKYDPPEKLSLSGDVECEYHPQFPKYTDIKRIQLFPEAWKEGTQVRITEKLHGMNTRLGVVQVDGEWRYMVGSHNRIMKQFTKDKLNAFWALLDERVMYLLNFLCEEKYPVVIYGERVGKGVQDLDYGMNEPQLRIFDIMVDGKFLSWHVIKTLCMQVELRTVPLLYTGPFSWCLVDGMTNGGSILANPSTYKSTFKGREGIVITPLEETYSNVLNDRLIGKSISCDYESRKGGTEYH
jgi:RNA ligase (TIGR02306 family)